MLRLVYLVVLLVAIAAGSSTIISAAGARPALQPEQQLAVLLASHAARQAPSRSSARLRVIAARRPITGERTVLPVVGRADPGGRHWLQVRLPGRPNGHTGWITQNGTLGRTTSWHIVIELARRTVTVYRHARVVRVFRAVVGKPSTPTPEGEFFVEEAVALPASAVGAPFALALSARSNVLHEFDGGPGQIALHSLRNVGGTLGTAASHGCVRLTARTMTWLVGRIGPGVPISIRG
jgi:lipoprotein-anchoring transpeptidase ErfK/SrfK